MTAVKIEDVQRAAQRIDGRVLRTPLLPTGWGDDDRQLFVKAENLQPIGAFKLRGAFATALALDEAARARGVVAYSSGNHGQAVAYAAAQLGIAAVVVIEDSAPALKIEATRSHGAEVVLVPAEERQSTAEHIAAERASTLIPPFDHADVIAGQGTVGLEIAEQLPDVAAVLVPISGGGLAAGIGVAIKAKCPQAKVFGVEPELAADTAASLDAGRLVRWSREDRVRTMADGLRAEPSEFSFAHLREVLDGMFTVSEELIGDTVVQLARSTRLVAEPSGAVAPAAFRAYADELPPGRVVAVVSGGNIDPQLFAKLLAA